MYAVKGIHLVSRENCSVAAFHTVSDVRVGHSTDKECESFEEGRWERGKIVRCT